MWKALGIVAHKTVKSMMKTWINQVGFPLVDVKRKNSQLEIKQRRFLSDGTKTTKSKWAIPFSVNEGNYESKKLLTSRSSKMKLKNENRNFIINSGRTKIFSGCIFSMIRFSPGRLKGYFSLPKYCFVRKLACLYS